MKRDQQEKLSISSAFGVKLNINFGELCTLAEYLPPRCQSYVQSGEVINHQQQRELNLLLALSLAVWSGGLRHKNIPFSWRVAPNRTNYEAMTAYWPHFVSALMRWDRQKGNWPAYAKWIIKTTLRYEYRQDKKKKADREWLKTASIEDLVNSFGSLYSQ